MSEMPQDWEIAALKTDGEWTKFGVDGDNFTSPRWSTFNLSRKTMDNLVGNADQIVVKFTSPISGKETYRTIHGARDVEQVADVIIRQMLITSPIGATR